MKKSLKLILVLIMAFTLLMTLTTLVFAAGADNPSGMVQPNTANTAEVQNVGNRIAGIIKVVGIFVSVIAIMFIGVKYMMGSAEEKAEYKKVLIPYLIGAVLLFGASVFADKIYAWASTLGSAT